MQSIQSVQLAGLTERLRVRGESVLHLRPDGGNEWIWGVFRMPRKGVDIGGLEIDMQDSSPRFRALASDAVDVCKYRETHMMGNDGGSRLVIRGQEYGVREKYVTEIGEAIIELSSGCSPVQNPRVAPTCMAAVTAANSCCDAPDKPAPIAQPKKVVSGGCGC